MGYTKKRMTSAKYYKKGNIHSSPGGSQVQNLQSKLGNFLIKHLKFTGGIVQTSKRPNLRKVMVRKLRLGRHKYKIRTDKAGTRFALINGHM